MANLENQKHAAIKVIDEKHKCSYKMLVISAIFFNLFLKIPMPKILVFFTPNSFVIHDILPKLSLFWRKIVFNDKNLINNIFVIFRFSIKWQYLKQINVSHIKHAYAGFYSLHRNG